VFKYHIKIKKCW